MMEYNKPDRKSRCRKYGGKRHIPGDKIHNGKYHQNQQCHTPINYKRNKQSSQNPLPSLEAKEGRKHMTQNHSSATGSSTLSKPLRI